MDEEIKKEEVENKEIEQCKKERDEYLDGWRRAKADLINFKKDEAERLTGFLKNGNENIIRDLLSVLDSFNLGIMSTEKTSPDAMKGMVLIKTQLEDTLRRYGVEKIKVVKGDVFNPTHHEAIGEVQSEYEDGTIAEEVESGYTLYDKVIRATKVRISKGEIKQQTTNN